MNLYAKRKFKGKIHIKKKTPNFLDEPPTGGGCDFPRCIPGPGLPEQASQQLNTPLGPVPHFHYGG